MTDFIDLKLNQKQHVMSEKVIINANNSLEGKVIPSLGVVQEPQEGISEGSSADLCDLLDCEEGDVTCNPVDA